MQMPAKAVPPAAPPASPLAAGATVPLAFIGSGLLAAVVGAGWLVVRPGLLALPHVHPHVVAWAHLWLLGNLLTVCAGAMYQLLPVLANAAFRGQRGAWGHLIVHLAGVTVMVPAFARGEMMWVGVGGLAVSAGVVLLALHVVKMLRAAARMDPVLAAFGLATAWLLLTVTIGVLLAANLHFGWWSVDVLAVLRAHAHMGVVGFFVTLIQGAMFRLVPMFTLGQAGDLRRVGWAIAGTQVALLVAATSMGLGWAAGRVLAAGLFAGAFALTAVELRRVWRTRKKRVAEPGIRGFLVGLAWLAVALFGGSALALGAGDWRSALAYGVVAVLGGVLMAVEGILCKIVPFLVWMRVYGPRMGKQVTPQAATLGLARAESLWVWVHMAGTALLAIGTAVGDEGLLVAGGSVFAVGQALLLASLVKAAAHVWRPVEGQPLFRRTFQEQA